MTNEQTLLTTTVPSSITPEQISHIADLAGNIEDRLDVVANRARRARRNGTTGIDDADLVRRHVSVSLGLLRQLNDLLQGIEEP